MPTPHVALATTLGLAAPSPSDPPLAEAQPRAPYRTVVRPRGSDAAKRSPGFVTVIDTDRKDRGSTRDGLAESLAEAPAVHVRSLGGLGQFGAVSIRGSAPQQVGMFLDGVPLGSSMAGLVDTGEVPTDGISRVEIHRGYVPIAYGAAALGGAIDLIGSTPEGASVEGGLGSWWTRRVGARIGVGTEKLRIGVGATYGGTVGNYRYYDDRGTTVSGDDRTARRSGNAYDRVVAQLRLEARRGAWRVRVHELAMVRRAGVPGPGSAQAVGAHTDQVVSRTIVRTRREIDRSRGARLEWLVGLGVEGRRFADPGGEVGLGVDDQRTTSVDVYLSPRWRTPLWRGAYLGLMADTRVEWIGIDQRVERVGGVPSGDATRRRIGVGAGVELEQFAWADRVQLVPAVRIDGIASGFAVADGRGEQDDQGRDDVAWSASPRLGARARVWGPLVLRGSFGRYFRAPTLVELFGDRGYFVGNEGLVPERGLVADGGVTIEHGAAFGSIVGHVAGFWVRTQELIQWIPAGSIARPENVAGARVRGLETSWALRSRRDRLELQVHYTLLDATDRSGDPGRDGNALPGRPRHDLFTRTSFGWEFTRRGVAVEPRVFHQVEVVARTFLDPSERYVLPPRAFQSIGAQLRIARRVLVALEVRNLLDVRSTTVQIPVAGSRPSPVATSDFIGYPLPGRSVWASFRVDFDSLRPRKEAA